MDFKTRWSAIDRLHQTEAGADWDWFLRRYHSFAVAVLRQLVPHDAVESAAEEFWGYLFQSRALDRVDRSGRFRSFLAGILTRYAAAWRRQNATDGCQIDPDLIGQTRLLPEADEVTLWAQQILNLALERLGRAHPNEELALRWFYGLPAAPGDPPGRVSATVIAIRLGCQANTVHQTLFRARARLRECLIAEVAGTIGSTRDLNDELLLLTSAMSAATPGLVESPDDREHA